MTVPQGRPFTTDEVLAIHEHAPGLVLRMVPGSSPAVWAPTGELTARDMTLIHRVPGLAGWGVLKVAGPGKGLV